MNTSQIPVVELTPELARQLLVNNKINRKVNPRIVNRYAAAIDRGEWKFTGDTLKVSDDGVLLDGQHRCLAVIKAGKLIKVGLVGNLPKAVFDVLDTGKGRTASDVIHTVGEYGSPVMVASASRYLWLYEKTGSLMRNVIDSTNSKTIHKPSNHQVLETASRYPDIGERQAQVTKWMNASGMVGLRRGIILALYMLFLKKDMALAESFWRRTLMGENIGGGDAEYLLRRRFISGQLIKERELIGIIIKAWNAKRQVKDLAVLRMNDTEKMPEIF